MTAFIIVAIILGVTVGGYLGMMIFGRCNGWKLFLGVFSTMVVVGCLLSGMLYLEDQGDIEKWNGGYCPVSGTPWTFSNADHVRNGGTRYYWYCEDCGKIIELQRQLPRGER